MSEQRPFFKGKDSSFGIFYPTDYIIAVFDSYETAQRAEQTLHSAGYAEDEAHAVPCKDVIADIEQGTRDASWVQRVKQKFSKVVGTEGRYWEEDLRMAREGHGFLAVHCPTEKEAERIQQLLTPENPIRMRRYLSLAVEDLVGESPAREGPNTANR